MRNIILCGFMGCGKSTVGRQLAEVTKRPFVDMDEFIAEKAGMTVPEIFERFGEADFRRREREACNALSLREGLIIAAGGGALIFQENVDALARNGDIVLLDVPLDVILQRLVKDTARPLLARSDRETAAKELYERRLPLYRKAASAAVDADGSARDVALAISKALKLDSLELTICPPSP